MIGYIVVSDSIVEIGVVVVVNVSVNDNNTSIVFAACVVDPLTIHKIKELLVLFGRVGVIIIISYIQTLIIIRYIKFEI